MIVDEVILELVAAGVSVVLVEEDNFRLAFMVVVFLCHLMVVVNRNGHWHRMGHMKNFRYRPRRQRWRRSLIAVVVVVVMSSGEQRKRS